MTPDSQTWEALASAAQRACRHAYAPYSHFHVGAAVLTDDGQIFAGCNVENASYGLTICAERSAAFAAVCGSPAPPVLAAVYVTSDPPVAASPCGACRQVLAQFGNPLVSFEAEGGRVVVPLSELLPLAFSR